MLQQPCGVQTRVLQCTRWRGSGRDADANVIAGRRKSGIWRVRARATAPSAASSSPSTSASTTGSLSFRRAALAFLVRSDALVLTMISNRHAFGLCTKHKTSNTRVSSDCVCSRHVGRQARAWSRQLAQTHRGAVCGRSSQHDAARHAGSHSARTGGVSRTE